MTTVNQLTKKNQTYVQSGGFLMIITKIGEFLLYIVMKLIEFIVNLMKKIYLMSELFYLVLKKHLIKMEHMHLHLDSPKIIPEIHHMLN